MRTRRYLHIALIAVLSGELAIAEIPFKTRSDIVNYGATAIGSPYLWGGGNWDPDDREYGGADCSGFVCKCWSLTRWTPYRVNFHGPYSTYALIQTPGTSWDEVDRADLLYGDAIVYRYSDGSGGHTYMYLSSDGWGEHEVYEARGSAYGIVHRWRTVAGDVSAAKGIRRTRLIENVDVTEHIIETDDGAPYYTDSGMTGNSQWDSYAPGCKEGDCRYRWVMNTRAETCTFQPDLPQAGWYRVYVTCNEDSPNVHDVGVTINHVLGSERLLWDQANSANLNRWTSMGSQSYFFDAGTTGTVIWDDFEAWPTDGDHVFRGDATKFVLDNRVEVDGVGGSAGVFASLRDALAWLAAHESEEPDVVDITCDTLLETGCIELGLWDDLTINGDADGNGIPVTIAVAPSMPTDWSRLCAMYVDIPIQHDYTLRDIVLVPQFVSPNYETGAYGLVIDEQNPSGEACAMSLKLEHVSVAGSLPGHMATAPLEDAHDLATLFGGTDAGYGAAVLQRTSDWAGDDGCRQYITATNMTVTHSATRGLAVRSAYTDWDIDGGMVVSYCGLEGIRADYLGAGTLTIRDSAGNSPNLISGNLDGGIVNEGDAGAGYVNLSNCIVSDNLGSWAGGITSYDATTIVRNCLLVGNESSGGGGVVFAVDGSVIIDVCTMVDNTAASSGGALYSWCNNLVVSNSILWNNGENQIVGNANLHYCDVQGGHEGVGNFDLDPAFVDPTSGDYHLSRRSPCVNTGDPDFTALPEERDIDGELRGQGGFVDVGADETPYWDGDMDQDGDVDQNDFVILADCMAGPDSIPAPTPPTTIEDCLAVYDFDEDGDVDMRDFVDFRIRETAVVPDIVLEVRNESGSVVPPPIYIEDGDWNNSTAKSTAPGLAGQGSRYIMYDLPNDGMDNTTFVPEISTAGLYEVFVTWGTGANCYDALYTVRNADGETTLLIDQIPVGVPDANPNIWVSLGQYRFEIGQSVSAGSVSVSEETVSGQPHPGWNRRLYADAARWVFISP